MVLEIVRAVHADATVHRTIAQDFAKLWFDPLTIQLFDEMGLFHTFLHRAVSV